MTLLAQHFQDYEAWLTEVKATIQKAQIKASLSVNRELIALYWNMGQMIVEKQEQSTWGDKIIPQLVQDLKRLFPEVKGFSRRNSFNIRKWYLFYRAQAEIVQQLVAQIPWGHNLLIITKIKDQSKFQPEYAGKMNYYLNAVDDLLKTDVDHPSIGLILCRSKDQVVVEYALRGITKPKGISEYQL
ncbi:MAG: PDDEXK nuclease domain-containing protein, partial [Bacteroidota bacterium]